MEKLYKENVKSDYNSYVHQQVDISIQLYTVTSVTVYQNQVFQTIVKLIYFF